VGVSVTSSGVMSRSGEPWLLVDRLGRLRQWFSYWLEVPAEMTTSEEMQESGEG